MDFERMKGCVEGISLPQDSKTRIMSTIEGKEKKKFRIPNLGLRLLAVAVCLGIVGFYWIMSLLPAEMKIGHVEIMTDYRGFHSLEELEESSDVIVEGIRLEESETFYSYTLCQFQITRVHKDSPGTLAPGSVISIRESVGYHPEDRMYLHFDGYELMTPGCEYLLFLTGPDSPSDSYLATGLHFGVVPLEDDGRYTIWDASRSRFDEIWQAAIDKFVEEKTPSP